MHALYYLLFPGIIRFWPSIAHESSWIEVSAGPDVQGQECCSLTDIQPVGSILATTTSTVGLVRSEHQQWLIEIIGRRNLCLQVFLTRSGGPATVACRMLKLPQGLLGGFSRRMSSLFWGNVGTGQEAVKP
jgi:nuclear pore complex protein Nup133